MAWPARLEGYGGNHKRNTHQTKFHQILETSKTEQQKIQSNYDPTDRIAVWMKQCADQLSNEDHRKGAEANFNTAAKILGPNHHGAFCGLVMSLQSYVCSDIDTLYYFSTSSTTKTRQQLRQSYSTTWPLGLMKLGIDTAQSGAEYGYDKWLRVCKDLHYLVIYSHFGIRWLTGICKRFIMALCSLIRTRTAPSNPSDPEIY